MFRASYKPFLFVCRTYHDVALAWLSLAANASKLNTIFEQRRTVVWVEFTRD